MVDVFDMLSIKLSIKLSYCDDYNHDDYQVRSEAQTQTALVRDLRDSP